MQQSQGNSMLASSRFSQKNEQINDWRTNFNWEKFYRTLSFILLAMIPFFIRDMIQFKQEVKRLNLQSTPWSFLVYSIIASFGVYFTRKLYHIVTYNYISSFILPEHQGVQRDQHTRKVQKWTFDIFYYSLTFAYGCIFFYKAPWFPITFSRGEDITMGTLTDWPDLPVNQPYNKYFTPFLIVQFGHHLQGLYDLMVVRRKTENKLWELFLHHLLANTLIFYSVYFNWTILAVSVLIIHDIGDVFIVMFKTCAERNGEGLLFKYLVFQMISGWFVTRIYLYPKTIIMPVVWYRQLYYHPIETTPHLQYANAGYIYLTILMSVLFLLHIYWFALMITLFTNYIKNSLKKKKSEQKAYGNEFDYYQYCDPNSKEKDQKLKKN